MGPAPLAHPLNILRSPEVVPVFLLHQPLLLAVHLAGLSAFGFGTVILMPGIAAVRGKEIVTVLALALSDWFCHRPVLEAQKSGQ